MRMVSSSMKLVFGLGFALSIAVGFNSGNALAKDLTPDEILKEVDKRIHSKDESAQVKMVIIDSDGSEKERKLEITRMAEPKKDAVRVKLFSPPDLRGTALLSITENGATDQWLYLPSSKQTRRIVGSGKSSNFLDSELSYEDMGSGYNSKAKNTMLKSTKEESVIESVPSAESTYAKIHIFVAMKDFLVSKMEYFDKSGKLMKTMEMADYKSFPGGVFRSQKISIKNVGNKRGTRLELMELKVNQGIPAKNFQPAALGR